eukprot:COSAG01_NODE_1853_length_9060_cov_13.741576_11_plen_95_part_00
MAGLLPPVPARATLQPSIPTIWPAAESGASRRARCGHVTGDGAVLAGHVAHGKLTLHGGNGRCAPACLRACLQDGPPPAGAAPAAHDACVAGCH